MVNYRRRWRFYETAAGRRPVRDFLDAQPGSDAAEIVAEMRHVARVGLAGARHLRGEIYEVRAAGLNRIFRILFAALGRYSHILLALEGFAKKTQRTPSREVDVAEQRLRDWRERGNRS